MLGPIRARDLEKVGIEYLTSESDGLMFRGLYDLNAFGVKVVQTLLGMPVTAPGEPHGLAQPWNSRSGIGEHVASVLLSHRSLADVAIIAGHMRGRDSLLTDKGTVYWLDHDELWDGGELDASPEGTWEYTRKPGVISRGEHITWPDFDCGKVVQAFKGSSVMRHQHAMSGRIK